MVHTQENNMPITKNVDGYRWGSKGPYPTKKKAEEVRKAAYASGYKQPKQPKGK